MEAEATPARKQGRLLDAIMCVAVLCSLGVSALPVFQAPASWPLTTVMLLAWVTVGFLVVWDKHLRANGRLAKVLVIFLAIQFVLGLVLLRAYWPPTWADYQAGLTGFDACLYHDYAMQLAAQGMRGPGPWDGINYSGIVYYYGTLYSLFGPNPTIAVIANCLAGMVTALTLYKFLLGFSNVRVAAGAAMGYAILPESILWNSLPMKESVVTLVFIYGLYSGTKLAQKPRWSRWLAPLLSFFCLIQLRMVLAIVLVVSLLIFMAVRLYRRPMLVLFMMGAALGMMVLLAGLSQATIREYGSPFSLQFYQSQAKIFNERPVELNAANPGASLGVMTSGALTEGKVYWVPVRFLMYYLNPPPWAVGYGSWDPFRMSSALAVWLLMPAMFYGLYRLGKDWKHTYPLLVPFLTGSVLISGSTPFLDDRLRMMMMPLFLGVAFWGLDRASRWWQLYLILPVGVAIGAALYYLFKSGGMG